jgi:hypothetical protein
MRGPTKRRSGQALSLQPVLEVQVQRPVAEIVLGGTMALAGGVALSAQLIRLARREELGVQPELLLPSLATAALLLLAGVALAGYRRVARVDGAARVVRWERRILGRVIASREVGDVTSVDIEERRGRVRAFDVLVITAGGPRLVMTRVGQSPPEASRLALLLRVPLRRIPAGVARVEPPARSAR